MTYLKKKLIYRVPDLSLLKAPGCFLKKGGTSRSSIFMPSCFIFLSAKSSSISTGNPVAITVILIFPFNLGLLTLPKIILASG